MKKTALLAVVFLFLFSLSNSSLYSQTKSKTRENSLKEGSWALMFGIDQNFRLTSLNGFTLYLKKHTSDSHAFRVGLSVSYENRDQNGNEGLDSLRTPYENKRTTFSISLHPSYYFYIEPKADVNFYLGLGAFGGYSHQTEFNFNYYNPSPYIHREDSTISEGFSYGVSSNLGVEFFPIKAFSLFAEYSLSFGYSKGQTRYDTYSTNEKGTIHEINDSSSKNFELINDGVTFGLCVYF